MVTMGGFEPPLDRLSTCRPCRGLGYMVTGPSGWTRTTTARVKGPACSVDTTEGLFELIRSALERMAGFEPAPQGLEGPQAAVTPHSLWFGLRVKNPSLRAGNAECSSIPTPNGGRWGSPAQSPFLSVVKEPALASWWAARDSNPMAPRRENGVTTRQRTIRTYRPAWRQRQDSNPDPRALEARMLRYTTLPSSHPDLSHETQPSRDLARSLSRQAQNKKAF